MKEAAVLRSLADAVASPVVAGRKSRKALNEKNRSLWTKITDRVVDIETNGTMVNATPDMLARDWKRQCKAIGIGGWFLWNWAFPLLLELAKLWIESHKQGQDSER